MSTDSLSKTASQPAPPFFNDKVAAAFAAFPDELRPGLLRLRALIHEIAEETPGVGPLEETLKWGQPSYAAKSGTPIRLGLPKTGGFALYVHCQTTVLSDFQSLFPETLTLEGNRGVHLTPDSPLPEDPLRALIKSALTYHQK